MIKFSLGLGVFYRPYLYMKYGLNNGIISEMIAGLATFMSNCMLVDCLMYLPNKMTSNSNLTYGQVVGYILDERENRVNPGKK